MSGAVNSNKSRSEKSKGRPRLPNGTLTSRGQMSTTGETPSETPQKALINPLVYELQLAEIEQMAAAAKAREVLK